MTRKKKKPKPATPPPPEEPHRPDDPLTLVVDGLRYVLDREPTKSGKKVVVSVGLADGGDGAPFTDMANLYAHRSRVEVATRVADAFGRRTGDIMGHLAVLLDQVERARETKDRPRTVALTAARREAALKLLDAPKLLDRAAAALDALGYVGEEENKRLVYLVATSRLLDKPLSAILMAPLASGKSDLLDKLTLLLPPEAVEFLSRISQQALYYAGPDHLRHKLVVVDEQAGAAESDYAIRTLQTKGLLRVAVPIKGKTESFEARGPIALLSGTTRTDLNPENLSRCLELTLDDSPEQTARILDAQRQAWAGKQMAKPVRVELWQDAQRLLEPFEVVVPFATRLTFPARTTKDRRDHPKLLTLVAAHALLHQRQRERDGEGRLLATVADYAAVHGLIQRLVAGHLDGLSPRAARLYRRLAAGEPPHITRREAAALLGTSYMTAARVLDELLAQELVREVAKEKPRRYRVIDTSLLGPGVTLTPPEELER